MSNTKYTVTRCVWGGTAQAISTEYIARIDQAMLGYIADRFTRNIYQVVRDSTKHIRATIVSEMEKE